MSRLLQFARALRVCATVAWASVAAGGGGECFFLLRSRRVIELGIFYFSRRVLRLLAAIIIIDAVNESHWVVGR